MTPGLGAAAAQPEPTPRSRRRPGRHLRPVDRPAVRRSPAVPVLVGTGIVLVALFALAAMHALLIGGQLELDAMQREVASETEEIRRIRLQVAELESPDRILDVARERLGMVQPAEVGYLAPAGVDTGDDSLARVEPATEPAPDPVATDGGDGTADPDGQDTAAGTAGQSGDGASDQTAHDQAGEGQAGEGQAGEEQAGQGRAGEPVTEAGGDE